MIDIKRITLIFVLTVSHCPADAFEQVPHQPSFHTSVFGQNTLASRSHFNNNFAWLWGWTPIARLESAELARRENGNGGETPSKNPNAFLENVRHHAHAAGQLLGISEPEVEKLLKPQRIYEFPVEWVDSEGTPQKHMGWRVIHFKPEGEASKGGIRWVPDLQLAEVMALAAEMDVKLTGSPLGGAKGGIAIDPKTFRKNEDPLPGLSKYEYARLMRAYVRAAMNAVYQETGEKIAFRFDQDVPAPDVNTSPDGVNLMNIAADETIKWAIQHPVRVGIDFRIPSEFKNIRGYDHALDISTPYLDLALRLKVFQKYVASFTGKTINRGGSHVRTEATGLGLAYATLEALRAYGFLKSGMAANRFQKETVAVHGFGNVGQGAVKSFRELGAVVQAVAEFDGESYALQIPGGISEELQRIMVQHLREHKTLRHFPDSPEGKAAGAQSISIKEFWSLKVDVMAPSAKENTVTEEVAEWIQAKVVSEGANGPVTYAAEVILEKKGIHVIPDVLANAGGVTVSHFEMLQNDEGRQWTPDQVRERLRLKIQENFEALRQIQQEYRVWARISLRTAAYIRWMRERLGSAYKPTRRAQLRHALWVVWFDIPKRIHNFRQQQRFRLHLKYSA